MSLYSQFCQTSSSASPPHVIYGRDTKFKVSIGGGISGRALFPLNQEERGRLLDGWAMLEKLTGRIEERKKRNEEEEARGGKFHSGRENGEHILEEREATNPIYFVTGSSSVFHLFLGSFGRKKIKIFRGLEASRGETAAHNSRPPLFFAPA